MNPKNLSKEDIHFDNTAVLIITYNPEPVLAETVSYLSQQYKKIIIVDNGSHHQGRETLSELIKNHPQDKVSVIFNSENFGISKALNQGFEKARELGFKWVLTFDQDSKPSPEYLSKGNEVLSSYPQPENVAMITPTLYEQQLQMVIPFRTKPQDKCSKARLAITSGAITRVDSFFDVSGYNEKLFIDYVDFDFCFRLRHNGFTILESNELILNHQLGQTQKHDFLFTNFITTHHNEIRRYYITRNRLYMYQKYYLLETDWVIEDSLNFVKDVFKILIAEEQKAAKMRNIVLGIKDFSTNKYGKI